MRLMTWRGLRKSPWVEEKHAPYLADEPEGAAALELHDVSAVMHEGPLTTLRVGPYAPPLNLKP